MSGKHRLGFTLIEMLVVIAIMVILASILLPVLGRARQVAWRARARDAAHQVVYGWKSYLDDYRSFPDMTIEEMDTNAMAILSGRYLGYNEDNNKYMEFTTNELAQGYLDPWGSVYQVRLDADYDGVVSVPAHGAVEHMIAVWSKGLRNGLNGQPDDPDDDIKTWQE